MSLGGGQSSEGNPAGSNNSDQFNLRWDDFRGIVIDSLWSLLTEEALVDCTLVCGPCEVVKVHRVVLSANSPYFRSLLSAHSAHPHPIIILHDVRYNILKLLVTFMYRGEVNVSGEEMSTLLKTADSLQIIGLSQTRRSPIIQQSIVETSVPMVTPENQQVYSKKARILEQQHLIHNIEYHRVEEEQQSPLALKKEDESGGEEGGSGCGWSTEEHKHNIDDHSQEDIPSQDVPGSLCLRYCCPYCSTNFPSQSVLSRHIMVVHPSVYSALYNEASTSEAARSASSSVVENSRNSSGVGGGGPGGGCSGSGGGPGDTSQKEMAHRSSISPKSNPDSNHMDELDIPPTGSGSSSNSIVCKFCGKPFPEVSQLIQHLPIHTGERPFKCEFCGKAFKLRHHMKDHARVHTGERPFRCSLCGKTFSRSTILKAHEKTHFPKNN